MPPVRSYTNWNSRTTDNEVQIEPYRKYFFICEGVNTETWYFKKLIDIRKSLNIHSLIDIRLLEKTEKDRDISYPKKLIAFAEAQKDNQEIAFDKERDKMIIVFDADIFEEKCRIMKSWLFQEKKIIFSQLQIQRLNYFSCFILKIVMSRIYFPMKKR